VAEIVAPRWVRFWSVRAVKPVTELATRPKQKRIIALAIVPIADGQSA
jgi:hypothetical protein